MLTDPTGVNFTRKEVRGVRGQSCTAAKPNLCATLCSK